MFNPNSYGEIVHNMCIHSPLPRAGTFEKVTDQDLLVMYHLWTRKRLSLPFIMVNHMIAAAELVKSTSCLPYGLAMAKIFRYYGVPLKGEGFIEDWTFFGLKNINQLKLDPFPARQFAGRRTRGRRGTTLANPLHQNRGNKFLAFQEKGIRIIRDLKFAKNEIEKLQPLS